jgi:hypothetical protein
MGWAGVWQAAAKQFGAEAVELRIFILVAVAFLAVMVLTGLRHAFRPAGPVAMPAVPEPPKRVFAAAPAQPVASERPATPFQPFRAVRITTKKSAKRTINHQRAPRPLIRREQ